MFASSLRGEGLNNAPLIRGKNAPGEGCKNAPPEGVESAPPLKEKQESSSSGRENLLKGKSEPDLDPPSQERKASEEHSGRSKLADDDEKQVLENWASPQDELRAILQKKLGSPVSWADWDWISEQIEARGIPWDNFVATIRQHAGNNWKNPVGLVKD